MISIDVPIKLPPRAIEYQLCHGTLVALILIAVTFAVSPTVSIEGISLAPFLSILIILDSVVVLIVITNIFRLLFGSTTYLVSDIGITIKSIFRTTTWKFSEIGEVNTMQGKLQKSFGICRLNIWSKRDVQQRKNKLITLLAIASGRPSSAFWGYMPAAQFWFLSKDAEDMMNFIVSKLTPVDPIPGSSSTYDAYLGVDAVKADLLQKR